MHVCPLTADPPLPLTTQQLLECSSDLLAFILTWLIMLPVSNVTHEIALLWFGVSRDIRWM